MEAHPTEGRSFGNLVRRTGQSIFLIIRKGRARIGKANADMDLE